MKTLLALLTILFAVGSWAQSPPSPLKVPHSHAAHNDGMVLMLGDDHVELVKDSKFLYLHFSDKLRDPVKMNDLDITLRAKGSATTIPLEPTKAMPNMAQVNLSLIKSNNLEIRAFRRSAPNKAHILKKDFAPIDVSKIPAQKASDHRGH